MRKREAMPDVKRRRSRDTKNEAVRSAGTSLLASAITLSIFSLVASSVSAQTAEEAQRPFAQIDLENLDYGLELPEWTDAQIRARFREARDLRFLDSPCVPMGSGFFPPSCDPDFDRRISWLWHEGGCEPRAYYLNKLAEEAGVQDLPLKVYAFPTEQTWANDPDNPGKLHVVSTNHQQSDLNYVWWDYHVAAVVKSSTSGTVYVLDPAIHPESPLPWLFWAHAMVDDLQHLNITFAQPDAYDRESPVVGSDSRNIDQMAAGDMEEMLLWEWYHQIDFQGGDPEDILGDEPPWFNEVFYPVSWYPYYISACDTCYWSSEALTPRCIQDCP